MNATQSGDASADGPMSTHTTMENLGQQICNLTNQIAIYLRTNNISPPSFQENSPACYPQEAECQTARLELLGKLQDLSTLALGPAEFLTSHIIYARTDALILTLLQEFDFFNAVPLGGSATYLEVSKHTKLPQSLVRRILRYSMTIRLFAEKEPGADSIVHTGITAHAARSPEFQAWICHVNVVQPAAQILPQVLRKLYANGGQTVSETELESAFSVLDVDKTGMPTTHFDFLQKEEPGKAKGWRELVFAQAMDAGRHMPGLHIEHLIQSSFDWKALGKATVVDIGGSGGHDAIVLAQDFPGLKVIVQDRPEQQVAFDRSLPADLRDRVSFQPHDFFSPQPVQDASVYMLKHVLHDWPDTKAIEILRNIVPALKKPHQRIVLFENVAIPAYGGAALSNIARTISAMDMFMLIMGNGKERTLEDWHSVVEKAGSRLKLVNNHSLPGVTAHFLEIARG